ncbi:MAG: SUMF1/EgtB/PvdO family nonheme iron enzyme [Nitrospirota bacterium]|nr:SUMF1/EgtB/PvdO family nonheme iron enzyme [Nitrospirota bacterium]
MTTLCSSLQRELEKARRRTDSLFALISPEAMYARPIPERHRLIFYLGHLEAFDWNQLCRWTLGKPAFHSSFDELFEAGIDPVVGTASTDTPSDWPTIGEVEDYNTRVRQEVDRALEHVPEEMVHVAIEHRLMHVETTVYLLHQLDSSQKQTPLSVPLFLHGQAPSEEMIEIPEGSARLGRRSEEGFGWDNEFEEHEVFVPVFAMSRYKTTNGQYLQFVNEGGTPPAFWKRQGDQWVLETMFERVPLPLSWPVYVTHQQAQAYADWKGFALPTEAQFHRAAYGTPSGIEQEFPWGDAPVRTAYGNFDFQAWDPRPVMADPQGASAFGIAQLVGNGWEWTSTLFRPFEGFNPLPTYPGYSARFFDQDHYVVKGGGPQTASRLLRRSFRNWFRQDYPYAHTSFRCVET